MDSKNLYDKEDEELLEKMGIPSVVTQPAVKASAQFLRKSFDKLVESINKNSASSDRLSRQNFWLTLIIAIATVLGVAISIYQFVKQ